MTDRSLLEVPSICYATALRQEIHDFGGYCQHRGLARLYFFTWKDNSQRYVKTDKVRKWLLRFSTTFCFVRSPKDGYHFHGMFYLEPHREVKYLKGIHIKVDPVVKPRESSYDPDSIPIEFHPFIPGLPGVIMIDVCKDIRSTSGGPKTSLPARIRSRKSAAARRALKIEWGDLGQPDIQRMCAYLIKNLDENENPTKYVDLIIKR